MKTPSKFLSKSKVSGIMKNTWIEIIPAGEPDDGAHVACLLLETPKKTAGNAWHRCFFPAKGEIAKTLINRVVKIHDALNVPKIAPMMPEIVMPKVGDTITGQLVLSKWIPSIPFTAKIDDLQEDIVYAELCLDKVKLESVLSAEATEKVMLHAFNITPYEDELKLVSEGKWSCGELSSYQVERKSKD